MPPSATLQNAGFYVALVLIPASASVLFAGVDDYLAGRISFRTCLLMALIAAVLAASGTAAYVGWVAQ